MNSFDEIQCEESSFAQLCFTMQEVEECREWMEERMAEAQAELDEISDARIKEIFEDLVDDAQEIC